MLHKRKASLLNLNDSFLRRSGQFEDQAADEETAAPADETGDNEIEIPEDLTKLSAEDVESLHTQLREAFDGIYGEGHDLSTEDLETLGSLTEAISNVRTELDTRENAESERTKKAEELARQVRGDVQDAPTDEVPETPVGEEEADNQDEDEDESVAASGSKKISVNMARLNSRQTRQRAPEPTTPAAVRLTDLVHAASDVPNMEAGHELDWNGVGAIIDKSLRGFNRSQFDSARRSGRHLHQQHGVATFMKSYPEEATVRGDGPEAANKAMDFASSERQLEGGSLVASGGWCAPSETLYDLMGEDETRDGMYSLPEINVTRGGVNTTLGANFADVYSNLTDDASWNVTEEQDEAGNYTADSDGAAHDKPCFKIECPDFTDHRLNLAGFCLSAGLLQQRGYPEVIASTVRGTLVAHDHLMSKRRINAVVDGSTAISMNLDQVGFVAPLLTSIELQTQQFRNVHRLARTASLEAVFPTWVYGAVRADLARRQGVDLIAVPNSRINAWFTQLGVAPQFVYNWQDLGTTDAASLTQYPTTVKFLLYRAGTWVAGGNDVITLDTVYDSDTLATNDYTALFTEESWLVVQRKHDSRVITVPVCADGGTNGGLVIDCDGTEVAAEASV